MNVEWGAAKVIVGCRRCGRAVKVIRALSARPHYCTTYCRKNDQLDRGRAARHDREWQHDELLRMTALHVIYPDMLAVMDRVQRLRPSYPRWSGELQAIYDESLAALWREAQRIEQGVA